MAVTSSRIVASQRPSGVWSWQQVFVVGLVLWLASVLVTGFTANLNMIPTVILLGSFLVPATAVVWYLDHYQSAEGVPLAGPLGVPRRGRAGRPRRIDSRGLAARRRSPGLPGRGLPRGAGESHRPARRRPRYHAPQRSRWRRTWAAVGFGFAALESSGYAFNALLVREGAEVRLSLGSLVFTELLRGILAPVLRPVDRTLVARCSARVETVICASQPV